MANLFSERDKQAKAEIKKLYMTGRQERDYLRKGDMVLVWKPGLCGKWKTSGKVRM